MAKVRDMYPYNRGPDWPKIIYRIIVIIIAICIAIVIGIGLYCELTNC